MSNSLKRGLHGLRCTNNKSLCFQCCNGIGHLRFYGLCKQELGHLFGLCFEVKYHRSKLQRFGRYWWAYPHHTKLIDCTHHTGLILIHFFTQSLSISLESLNIQDACSLWWQLLDSQLKLFLCSPWCSIWVWWYLNFAFLFII